MKKRSVAASHAPLFLGLLEMGLQEQDRSVRLEPARRRRSPSESPRDTLPRSGKCQSGSYTSKKYMTVAPGLFVILALEDKTFN